MDGLGDDCIGTEKIVASGDRAKVDRGSHRPVGHFAVLASSRSNTSFRFRTTGFCIGESAHDRGLEGGEAEIGHAALRISSPPCSSRACKL